MKNKILLVAMLLLATQLVSANSTLSWQDVQDIALKHNRELKIAKERLAEAELQLNIADVANGFTLDSSASYRQSGDFDAQTENRNSTSVGLSARKLLYDGGYTKNSVAVTKERLVAQQYSYQITEANVRMALRQNFCDVIRAEQLIALSEKIVERRQQQLALVSLRYDAGLEHRGAYLTAKANLSEALNNLEQDRRSLVVSYEKLRYVMGGYPSGGFKVTGNLELLVEVVDNIDFSEIVNNTPLLKEVSSLIIQREYSLAMQKANYLPNLSISGSTDKNYVTQGGLSTESEGWSAGLSLAFNLFDSGKKSNQLKSAEVGLNQAELALKDSHQKTIVTLQEQWHNLKNSLDNIAVAQDFLVARQERSTIAEAQYSSGLINFDSWVIIENDLIRAQRSFINSKLDALVQEARWLNAKGEGFNE